MEPSVPFHTLVIVVDSEIITNEKIRALDLPPEIINIVTLKPES